MEGRDHASVAAMSHGPDIARIGALIGDPARASMLTALMSGKALTASELARIAGIGAPTVSAHLVKLAEGGLIAAEKQGRHRYVRLAGAEIAEALEALLGLAQSRGHLPFRPGPDDQAMRRARVCYDDPCHLVHAQRVAAAPRRLLTAVDGLELVAHAEAEACCGAAGTYNLTQPAMSQQVLDRKLGHLAAVDPDWIVTGNPGCMLQLASGARLRGMRARVAHPIELLDAAYGTAEGVADTIH